ncbi:MAG: YlxR family protein [Clostridia bacterium]|nr:YlxR family protein [Clostridia bacterium]
MHTKKERRCVACREPKQQSELLRVAKIDNEYIIDKKQKLGGRGAYVCLNKDCINLAIKKRAFNRAFKTNIDSELYVKLGEYEQN